MSRKGPDTRKLEKIMNIVKSAGSKGVWIRELARQTNLPVATVHLYVNKFLSDKIEIKTARIGKFAHSQMKIVKIKGD